MAKLKLTYQQAAAAELIEDWYKTYKQSGKQIFVLSGYAGTGKTTLVNYIIDKILKIKPSQVAFATPTGKAAAVLIQKGSPATTIHRLIYSAVEHEYETEINGRTVKGRKIEFVKRKNIGNYKLIVLDEISMVNKKMMEDLLSYGIPILATGDLAQLPAIASESHNLLENPDFNLTEIVRQAKDNAILYVATQARNGESIAFGEYNDGEVIVIDRNMLTSKQFTKYLLEADQVICGKNTTRIKLNKLIRELKGYKDRYPGDGEKLICELNNYEIDFNDQYSLVNGMSGTVTNFKILDEDLKLATITFTPDFVDAPVNHILIESKIFYTNEYKYEKHQNIYFMFDGTYRLQRKIYKSDYPDDATYKKKMRDEFMNKKKAIATFMINQFDFGYAITCHKSQGSQWDNVVVIDESNVFGKEANRFLYTAITRAAKRLILIR